MEKNKLENIFKNLVDVTRAESVHVSDSVRKSLHNKLIVESQKKKKKLFFKLRLRAIMATAASLLILLSLYMVFEESNQDDTRKLYHQSTVASGNPVTVTLIYNAKVNLGNVEFSIELDSGLEFYSEDDKIRNTKSHKWAGKLKKGQNKVPFVVKSKKHGIMKIRAYAKSETFKHTQEIVLDAKKHKIKVSMFKISSSHIK